MLETLASITDNLTDSHSLIIGDLNCGIPFKDSETRSFQNTHLFQALLKTGRMDAWRERNPKAREFSLFSTNKNNGVRYNHALASPSFDQKIKSVQYLHEPREEK